MDSVGNKFLFMDERYPDDQLPPHLRYVSLTGLLFDNRSQYAVRSAFYSAIAAVYPAPSLTVPRMPKVHASALFPDLGRDGDEVRLSFLATIAEALVAAEVPIRNVGYVRTQELMDSRRLTKANFGPRMLSLCFFSLLRSLEDELIANFVWPVMEKDNTPLQDAIFSAIAQDADHANARLPDYVGKTWLRFDRLGETLYSNKMSALATVTDIVAYVLHKKYLRDSGASISTFASRIAAVADALEPCLVADEVITMKIG